jgi:DNA polymerase-3 subunit alpha
MDRVLARAAGIIQDRQRGQNTLFGLLEEPAQGRPEADPPLPEWPQHQLLAHEKELLGFYVTGHPLTPYAPILEKYALHNTSQLASLSNRAMTRIGGLVVEAQKGVSKKSGKPYVLVTLEDLEGSVQVLCLNENYDKFIALLLAGKALLVTGEVNLTDDKPKIFPQEIIPLEEAPRLYTRQVHLRLQMAHLTASDLEAARDLATAHPGQCPLFLCLKWPGGEVLFIQAHEKYRVKPSPALQEAADKRFGEQTYYAKVDTTLAQRAPRQWEKRSQGGNGEE